MNLRLQRLDHEQMVAILQKENAELRTRYLGTINKLVKDLSIAIVETEQHKRDTFLLEEVVRENNIILEEVRWSLMNGTVRFNFFI